MNKSSLFKQGMVSLLLINKISIVEANPLKQDFST